MSDKYIDLIKIQFFWIDYLRANISKYKQVYREYIGLYANI